MMTKVVLVVKLLKTIVCTCAAVRMQSSSLYVHILNFIVPLHMSFASSPLSLK